MCLFPCRESCGTAKPSWALQIHFRNLHCLSQALFQLLLGVIYARWVQCIPGHFGQLRLLTSLHHSSCCAEFDFRCIFNASRNPEVQQTHPTRGKCHGLGSSGGLRLRENHRCWLSCSLMHWRMFRYLWLRVPMQDGSHQATLPSRWLNKTFFC